MIEIAAVASVAATSFKALKAGFSAGRDLESMASDLSRWMGALSDLDQAEKEIKNPPIFRQLFGGKSVEQEALEVFAAKKKAQEQRYELKMWVSMTLGTKAWEDLIATEGRIRRQRKETIYRQRERRRKFVEVVAWIVVIGAAAAALFLFVMLLKAHSAKAAEQMTTCRKVRCEKMDDRQMVCIFRGQNNTIESQFFEYLEFIPSEYQCKYDPSARKDITIQETLKAIRDSQK